LLVCALITFLRQRKTTETLEPVTILTSPFVLPAAPRDRFAMTFGQNRRWVARAEEAFFGKRKSVTISADIIEFSVPAFTNLESALNADASTFNQTNVLNAWFLTESQLKEIGQRISRTPGMVTLTHPRLQIADGMGGTVFMGQSVLMNGKPEEIGFSMRCAATLHEDSTEMLTEIVQSELNSARVQTNLAINARLNVPNGKGILLVKWPGNNETNGWGIVVHSLQ